MTSIEITTPDGAHHYTLGSELVTIGRLSSNDIVLPYSHISRKHAELRWLNGAWWISDLHSTNGLHVSGQRLNETPLEHGAVVALSPHVSLRLTPDAPSPAPEAPLAPQPPPEPQPISPPPLSAFAPRSPFAEDESPYYPHMRPEALREPSHSRQPASAAAAPAAPAVSSRRSHADVSANTINAQRAAREATKRRLTAGSASGALHICQTCGQLTSPDAVYCQSCHHSIATECPNCRLSLLPIQDTCPRCQTQNPGAARKRRPTKA
ncbi:MAG TPA: FHA domain-containing protein [Ktedonobacterales bacterium]